MASKIKLRVLYSDGRKEKVALEITSGSMIALDRNSVGIDGKCFLQIRKDHTALIADGASTDGTLNQQAGTEFTLKVGDVWEVPAGKIEFLILPELTEGEDATRHVSVVGTGMSGELSGSTPVPERDSPTSIIMRMQTPQHPVEPSLLKSAPRIEVRGEVPPPDVERMLHLQRIFIPLAAAALGSELLFALGRGLTSGFTLPWGSGLLLGASLTAGLAGALVLTRKWTKLAQSWTDFLRPLAIGANGLAFVVVLLSALVHSQPEPEQAPAPIAVEAPQAVPQAAVAPAPAAAPTQTAVSVATPVVPVSPVTPPPTPVMNAEVAPDMPPDMSKDEFFSAIRSGDLGLVRKLVETRAVDVNLTLDRGRTGLQLAASRGDMSLVQYLVSKRANVNAQDPGGTTALMWATFKRHKDIVKYLVKHGANLKLRREDGTRAIDLARRYGLSSYVPLLTPKGETPLTRTAKAVTHSRSEKTKRAVATKGKAGKRAVASTGKATKRSIASTSKPRKEKAVPKRKIKK